MDEKRVPGESARRLYDDVESAMTALPVPVEARELVRATIAGRAQERIWINPANGYVAIAPTDGEVTAYIARTYVDVRTEDGYARTELPGYQNRSAHARTTASSHRLTSHCPVHHTELPQSGQCDDCG